MVGGIVWTGVFGLGLDNFNAEHFQSGVMETGQEKSDSREKSLNDENKELKHQIISLQRNLEEKDARIRELESRVKTQMNNPTMHPRR